ncbi:MAG TPA: response regulator transcription factor [Chthonomonadaceae bacterium]|nr:response regulator transcription factor [Chthonomonadaceae bacterium]
MITLVIADDHRIVRQGLTNLLEAEEDFQIVGEAENGLEALECVERLAPDILVLDLLMPKMNGMEVVRHLHAQASETCIIVLSMLDGEPYITEVLKYGAMGYVLKEAAADVLVQAVRIVRRGVRYLCPLLADRAIDAYVQQVKPLASSAQTPLTARECEILRLSAQGTATGAIAARLVISRRTVETHRANIMKKLGIHNQTELIHYALKQGFISLDASD